MKSNILTSWLLQRETLVALGDQQRIGRGVGWGGGACGGGSGHGFPANFV